MAMALSVTYYLIKHNAWIDPPAPNDLIAVSTH
jgi:hypothetical protein